MIKIPHPLVPPHKINNFTVFYILCETQVIVNFGRMFCPEFAIYNYTHTDKRNSMTIPYNKI